MSGHVIPLWKQELLKRKQAKLGNEKLTSDQASNSKPRSSFANSVPSGLNHRSADTQKKTDTHTAQQHGLNKNSDVPKKGTTYNRNIVLEDSVDSFDTRRKSGNLKSNISNVDSGPNRLDNFEERSMNRNTEKYNKNFVRGSYDMHGMTQHNRPHIQEEKTNFAIVDEDKKDGLIIGNGVDSEHIKPGDVKKMWQQQATKDDTSTKSQVTHPKIPSPIHSTKEISRGPPPSLEELHNRNNTQVVSSPSSAPKAYKSPFAKTNWRRQASAGDEKSPKNVVLQPKRNEVKAHAIKPLLSNCNVASDEKVEDEHIQSVKSLLGLFGGKVRQNIGRKISDNVSLGNKTAKQVNGKDYHTSEIKTSASKKPGLFKHHSEPNLFFPADNDVFTDVSPMSNEAAPEEVVSPSHHVSRGIQDRMTRLRRASHSNMEDMDGFIEYQNGVSSDPDMVKENHELPQKESIQQADFDPEKSLSNNLKNNKPATVQNSVSNHNREELFNNVLNLTSQNDKEKPRLSGNVNSYNKVPSPVSNASNTIKTHYNTLNNTPNKHEEIKSKSQNQSKSQGQQNLPEQSFDKLLSVFGPRVAKKAAIEPDLTDAKEHKSENKYQSKQTNYVVENNQSDSGLHNPVVSTEYSTGINQDKQKVKPVIKNEENIGKFEEKSEKKPRRKGLHIVDPLAVLQLTKDPILLKEKPSSADLGFLKESPTGRKPKVEIIKHEPDKRAKIAQINRAWDLDNVQPTLKQNDVGNRTMPASTVTPHNVPVTSIDEIPVSVIDDFVAIKSAKDVQPKSNLTTDDVKVGDSTFYDGTLSSASAKVDTESDEIGEEFIPVSSIDAETDLGPPPEIVFDKMPTNIKSCFPRNGKKPGKLSFFEHVFIHDYQSENAAASDWDFENGASFSSYTPAALKQYEDVGKTYNAQPAPMPVTPPTPSEETGYDDEPLITYNEEESFDFTESSDSTAGALLF